MSRKKATGTCRICGNTGDLSFEHVPQRAAFNDKPVIRVKFEDAIALGPEEITKGEIQQRGLGGYTLCPKCNNLTGHLYGSQFVDWCYQAMQILNKWKGEPSLIHRYKIFPLAILKQIMTMFFSVNPVEFREANPELVRFVLNRDIKYLPPKYGFLIYYNIGGKFRFDGIMVLGNLLGKIALVSEITYPPFGYLMTINSEPPDDRLYEITYFSRYNYNESKTLELKLPVLPTYTVYPGDYRTKKEIYEQAATSLQHLTNV